MAALAATINGVVDTLRAFGDEVTRVAREVGTEGTLGGQAEVVGVSGTWERLTESVNHLAGNLTTQVRAIAAVATAVTAGDLTRQITVDAKGEVAELKDNINQMIANLKETTRTNQEQDWLKTNLAAISSLMQGHRDLTAMTSLVMSELAPLVDAQYGAFFLAQGDDYAETTLELTASYAGARADGPPPRFVLGESLVGQCALDKRTIVVNGAPAGYVTVASGLGGTGEVDLIVLPVLFEGRALGVIELASVTGFTEVHRDLLEGLKETIGVNVNTILANSRTEALLTESQRLAQELRTGSEQLRAQQDELQRSNTELAEKATLLAAKNRDIEIKNSEIEQARQELEDRAQQLATASKYKSEFMANMSHELRTPLNSALVLAKLLSDNLEANLTAKQVEFAKTIYSAGSDLLQLINDILDLAKVEAGRMDLQLGLVPLRGLVRYVEKLYRPLATERGLHLTVEVDPALPEGLHTDEHRLQQVLRNLLSNAVKFTHDGGVRLHIRPGDPGEVSTETLRAAPSRVAFEVSDTGIGIPADKLAVIFEAFQQADGTTSRKYGGTGLGLSISRELTQLLGGELAVRSEPGVGSTFTLYLPLAAEPVTVPGETPLALSLPQFERVPEVESSPAVAGEPPGGAIRFRGEKVLIVDDDLRNVFALTSLLELRGLRVSYADNGVAGIRALEQDNEIALVLMDVMMPELDGNATIAAIREMSQHDDLLIIAVTAKAMKEDRAKSLASGADEYVTKPVDTDHLLRLIAAHLDLAPLAGH